MIMKKASEIIPTVKETKITNSFNINDEVWIMCDNKTIKTSIVDISLSDFKDKIFYYVEKPSGGKLYAKENLIFKTKQELIKSL